MVAAQQRHRPGHASYQTVAGPLALHLSVARIRSGQICQGQGRGAQSVHIHWGNGADRSAGDGGEAPSQFIFTGGVERTDLPGTGEWRRVSSYSLGEWSGQICQGRRRGAESVHIHWGNGADRSARDGGEAPSQLIFTGGVERTDLPGTGERRRVSSYSLGEWSGQICQEQGRGAESVHIHWGNGADRSAGDRGEASSQFIFTGGMERTDLPGTGERRRVSSYSLGEWSGQICQGRGRGAESVHIHWGNGADRSARDGGEAPSQFIFTGGMERTELPGTGRGAESVHIHWGNGADRSARDRGEAPSQFIFTGGMERTDLPGTGERRPVSSYSLGEWSGRICQGRGRNDESVHIHWGNGADRSAGDRGEAPGQFIFTGGMERTDLPGTEERRPVSSYSLGEWSGQICRGRGKGVQSVHIHWGNGADRSARDGGETPSQFIFTGGMERTDLPGTGEKRRVSSYSLGEWSGQICRGRGETPSQFIFTGGMERTDLPGTGERRRVSSYSLGEWSGQICRGQRRGVQSVHIHWGNGADRSAGDGGKASSQFIFTGGMERTDLPGTGEKRRVSSYSLGEWSGQICQGQGRNAESVHIHWGNGADGSAGDGERRRVSSYSLGEWSGQICQGQGSGAESVHIHWGNGADRSARDRGEAPSQFMFTGEWSGEPAEQPTYNGPHSLKKLTNTCVVH